MNEFLYGILKGINSLTNNYGWAMVLFTVLVRLVLTPFDIKSRVGMRKTTKLQPQLTALQKKYANDKEKLNQKTAELYKKEHINPLSSCLPLLLTYPILIAVFNAMRMMANEMTLNQVLQVAQNPTVMPVMDSWLWVKNLWMPDSPFACALPDLSMLQQIPSDIWTKWFAANQEAIMATDLGTLNLTVDSFAGGVLRDTVQSIFTQLSSFEIYQQNAGTIPGMNVNLLITSVSIMKDWNGLLILPVLSAVTQFAFTKITGGQQDESNANTQQSSMKFMNYFFPLFSLFICFSSTAAFALYWVSGNLVSMAQTLVINRILENKEKNTETLKGNGTIK